MFVLRSSSFYCLSYVAETQVFSFHAISYRESTGRDCFHYPRVSPGDPPLTKKPEDSGYEIAFYTLSLR